MITQIHHVAVLTSSLEQAIQHYRELLGCPAPTVIQIDKPGVKLRSAMLPVGASGQTNLQIIEPSVGPGVAELQQHGEGTIFEVGFQVDHIEAFCDQMVKQGIPPLDFAEQPITEKYVQARSGNRYFFLPRAKMRGTRTEFVEVVRSK